MGRDKAARRAWRTIRGCLRADRFSALPHFIQRMDERGLVWPDVMAVVEEPRDVRDDGEDRHNRPKWVIAGEAPDGLAIEVVCVLDVDEHGDMTVLITIY